MKKSKLIALILASIFILTACGESGSGYLFDYTQQLSGPFYFKINEGFLFVENLPLEEEGGYQKIKYLDFESGQSTVYCTKPGCTHEYSDETCWGNLNSNKMHMRLGEKFYSLEPGYDNERDIATTELYVSDSNRQNEKLLETFDGDSNMTIYVHKDSMYLILNEQFETSNATENEVEVSILKYDFREEKIIGEVNIKKGHEASLSYGYGIYDDKLIYRVYWSEKAISWDTMTEEEIGDIQENKEIEYLLFDTETLEVEYGENFEDLLGMNVAIDELHEVYNNIAYYDTDGVLYAYDLDSDENTIIYEGELEAVRTVGDTILCSVSYENNEAFIYDPETKESKAVYRPYGGDWHLGHFLWHEHGDYIYMDSASNVGAVGEYEQYSPFIIKVHKDDIYKEEYEAEIVS